MRRSFQQSLFSYAFLRDIYAKKFAVKQTCRLLRNARRTWDGDQKAPVLTCSSERWTDGFAIHKYVIAIEKYKQIEVFQRRSFLKHTIKSWHAIQFHQQQEDHCSNASLQSAFTTLYGTKDTISATKQNSEPICNTNMSLTNLNYSISKKINLDTKIYNIQFYSVNLLVFTLLHNRKIKTFNFYQSFSFVFNPKISFPIFQISSFFIDRKSKDWVAISKNNQQNIYFN